MGILLKQSSASFLISIASIILGIVNNLYIYPKNLETYGFIQAILNLTLIIIPFSYWGMPAVMNKYHTLFMTKKYAGFAKFGFTWFLTAFFLFSLIYWSVFPIFVGKLDRLTIDFSLFNDYKILLFFIIFLLGISNFLKTLSGIYKRIVIPNFLIKVLGGKIMIPIIIIVVSYFSLSKEGVIHLLIISYLIIILLLFIYVKFRKQIVKGDFKNEVNRNNLKDIFKFGSFNVFNDMGMTLTFGIDIVMVQMLIGNTSAGIYAIFIFLANVIKLPTESLGLFTPIISKFWASVQQEKINDYYKRISISVFCIMLGIFLLIYVSMDNILIIMDKTELLVAKSIFVFISVGILINGLNGINGIIITQSKYYKTNLYFILILAFMNIFMTYYLISYVFQGEYKAAGAACATAFSLSVYNICQTIFVYYKFKMHPFSSKLILLFLLALAFLVSIEIIPEFDNPYFNLVLYSIVILVLYFIPLFFLKISNDLNQYLIELFPFLKRFY